MRIRNKSLITAILFSGILSLLSVTVPAQKNVSLRTITVITEPNAQVWIDDVNYGTTDTNGKLTLKTFPGGTHKIRVRAIGFKEITQPLLPTQKGDLKIALVKTLDQAELAFQQAETESDKEKASELYGKAIKLRPKYPEAQVGLARALLSLGDSEGALTAIREARKARPVYPEASAVEGRIYREYGEEEKAVAAFKRAIKEGGGVQAEANTGLGMIYQDKAAGFRTTGEFESEKNYYLEAAKSFNSAIQQLAGSPDAIVVYQLLGDNYERAGMYQEALRVYEEFLRLFPDSNEATTVRSFIVQINKRLKGEQ